MNLLWILNNPSGLKVDIHLYLYEYFLWHADSIVRCHVISETVSDPGLYIFSYWSNAAHTMEIPGHPRHNNTERYTHHAPQSQPVPKTFTGELPSFVLGTKLCRYTEMDLVCTNMCDLQPNIAFRNEGLLYMDSLVVCPQMCILLLWRGIGRLCLSMSKFFHLEFSRLDQFMCTSYVKINVKNVINEHWLHSNRLSMFNDISKRKTFFARSSNQANADSFGLSRGQGGVCILWSSNITGISPLNECIHDRICGIRVQNRKGAIFNIYCVYMPSRGCEGDLATSLDELSGIIENTETGSNSIVCGDFNGDMGMMGGERGFKNSTKEGRLVYNFMVKHDLWAANLSPSATGPINTFYGPNGDSCIDYILVPNVLKGVTQECITMENEPLNVSDHYPITCTFKLGSVDCNTIIIEPSGSIKWNKMRPERLAHDYTLPVDIKIRDLVDSLSEKQPTSALIDEAFDRIETILISHDHVIRRSKTSSHLKPY